MTDVDKKMNPHHFGERSGRHRIRIRINPEIRIRFPGHFLLRFWPWRRFALSEHTAVKYIIRRWIEYFSATVMFVHRWVFATLIWFVQFDGRSRRSFVSSYRAVVSIIWSCLAICISWPVDRLIRCLPSSVGVVVEIRQALGSITMASNDSS